MTAYVKRNGKWQIQRALEVKRVGRWNEVKSGWVKRNGAWQLCFEGRNSWSVVPGNDGQGRIGFTDPEFDGVQMGEFYPQLNTLRGRTVDGVYNYAAMYDADDILITPQIGTRFFIFFYGRDDALMEWLNAYVGSVTIMDRQTNNTITILRDGVQQRFFGDDAITLWVGKTPAGFQTNRWYYVRAVIP